MKNHNFFFHIHDIKASNIINNHSVCLRIIVHYEHEVSNQYPMKEGEKQSWSNDAIHSPPLSTHHLYPLTTFIHSSPLSTHHPPSLYHTSRNSRYAVLTLHTHTPLGWRRVPIVAQSKARNYPFLLLASLMETLLLVDIIFNKYQ